MITNHLSTNFPKDVVMRHRRWLSQDEISVFVALFSSDSLKTSCPKPSHSMTRNRVRSKGAIKGKKTVRKTVWLLDLQGVYTQEHASSHVFSDSPQVLTFSFIFTQVRTLQCFLKGDLSHGKIQLLLMCCHNIYDWLCTEPREAQPSFWPSFRTFFCYPIYIVF